MNSSEAYDMAQGLYSALDGDDYRFERSVYVRTKDGTSLFYQEAFAEKYEDWWIVFTKNFGFIVMNSANLISGEVEEYVKI